MSTTMTPREIHEYNKEFILQALIGLNAPQDVQDKVRMASAVEMRTSRNGDIQIGMVDVYGSRTTWSTA